MNKLKLMETVENLLLEAGGVLEVISGLIKKLGGKTAKTADESLLTIMSAIEKRTPGIETEKAAEKAFKSAEFRIYREALAQKAYKANKDNIDRILMDETLTTAQKISKLNNEAGVHPYIATDVKAIHIKETGNVKSTTPSNTSVGNAKELSIKYDIANKEMEKLDEYLWNRVNNKGLKRFFLLKRISRSNWIPYRNELFNHLNKTLSERFEKETKLKLTEVQEFFENLDLSDKNSSDKIINDSVRKFNEILNKQVESLGTYGGILKKLQPDVITSLRNYLSGKGTKETFWKDYKDAFKMSSAFMAFGTLGELLAGDLNSWEKIKDEISLKYVTIVIPGINTWYWGLNALYRWGKVGFRNIGWSTKPLPKGESGIFTNPDFPLGNKENDPDGIR